MVNDLLETRDQDLADLYLVQDFGAEISVNVCNLQGIRKKCRKSVG